MAGIGLTLRKLVADQTYLRGAAAYFSSGVISAGPWLISVVSLAALQGAVAAFLSPDEHILLFATITYAFVASSILTGPIQMVLTRIVADHIFVRKFDAIVPAFTNITLQSAVLLIAVMVPFVAFAPFSLTYRLLAASLFLSVALNWLVLVVISAVQDYLFIVVAFLAGYGVSGGGAIWLGKLYGLEGALAGFALGQVMCLGLLSRRITLEFPAQGQPETPLIDYWLEYWNLALIGLLYYLGLWAEKLCYWFSRSATTVSGFYQTFPPYDSAILLAYLLTIPASAVFLVNLETHFYEHYHAFFSHILGSKHPKRGCLSRGTFEQITQARLAMIQAARSGLWTLLKVQGTVTAFALLIAPDLANLIKLPPGDLSTLCIAILAASGQVFVLYAMLLLLYLDARHQTLIIALVFASGNLGLTILFNWLAPGIYGLGYLLSTVIAACLGLSELSYLLSNLDYLTFMLQPLESARKPSGAHTKNTPAGKTKGRLSR